MQHMEFSKNKTVLKWAEGLLMVLLALCFLWYLLDCLIPFALICGWYHLSWIKGLLRAAGLVLSAFYIFLPGRKQNAPRDFLLYGICLAAVVSSILQGQYGYADNFNNIAWMTIVFALFYGASYRIRRGRFRVFLLLLFAIVLMVWFAACCLSIHQFVHLIGSNSNKATSLWLRGRGFVKSRLFGIFGYPEYGAVTSVLLLICSGYYFVKARFFLARLVLIALSFPLFWYILLSGSRNAVVGLYTAVFCGALLFLRNIIRGGAVRKLPLVLGGALVSVLVLHLVCSVTISVSEKIPPLFTEETEETEETEDDKDAKNTSEGSGVRVSRACTIDGAVARFPAPFVYTVEASGKASAADGEEAEEGILTRKDVQRNPTTFRLTIWKNYLGLYKEIGLFGLSPENSSKYIKDNHPDLFIADYIRRAAPDDYARGYVFHPHSGYLKVFSSTGFLGSLLLAVFMVFCVADIVRYLRRSERVSPEFLFSFLLVLAGAVTAFFDTELFFVYNPATFFFWLSLSALYRTMRRSEKSRNTAGSEKTAVGKNR